MTLLSKIGLSKWYAKPVYIISSILTLAMSVLVIFKPVAIPLCILLKLFSVPVILQLFISLNRKQSIYFFLNLGISRNEYYIIPFAVEFIAFIVLMIITGFIGYAII